ncbi:hypothetical protein C8Q75DRAFT_849420, partial [Abortiporus biennis]
QKVNKRVWQRATLHFQLAILRRPAGGRGNTFSQHILYSSLVDPQVSTDPNDTVCTDSLLFISSARPPPSIHSFKQSRQ